ncbi:MAG TPA: DUF4231 domain-containing protein [Propionibacteriaceae bacterium]
MDADTADSNATGPTAAKAGTDRQLELVWRRHRQWSRAANAARARLDRWRLWNLLLLVLGALAGAMAAQTWLASGTATGFAIVAAAALALAGFIQAKALNANQTTRWTRARAASETLKAELYQYLLRVPPYAGENRAQALLAQLDIVQARAHDRLVDQQTTPADDHPAPSVRTFDDYVAHRAQDQADWHRKKSGEHARHARRLRICQLLATGLGVILSAISGFVPSWRVSTWTAAATTIAAAIGAHLAATQHQRIAAAYASTTEQLDQLIADIDPTTAIVERQAQFVADVERVLVAQNDGWMDLISPTRTAP